MFSNDFKASNINPFRSFLMGGFECADQQNAFSNRGVCCLFCYTCELI